MSLGQSVAGQIVPTAVSTVGGALTPSLALWLGLAVPVVGGIVGGVALAMTVLLNRKRGQQKLASSRDADDIEPILQDNVRSYLASGRTLAEQAAALDTFDRAWAWLASSEGCGNPQLGTPGQRCISERQRGGSAAWCPTGTGCDWFLLYRDPIANDPVPVQTAAQESFFAPGSFSDLPGFSQAAAAVSASPNVLAIGALGLGLVGLVAWAVAE